MTDINEWESEIEFPDEVDERMLRALRFIILREERERLTKLESTSDDVYAQIEELESKLEQLRDRLGDDAALVATLEPVVAPVISRQISENRDEMAQTIGPVIGESIRVQLRHNREDIVDALYPIIGETVAKSVRESFREFQRSIDRQLKKAVGISSIRKTVQAQLKGVSPAELALRDSLPFSINHIFLIQHDSGLLLGQHQLTDTEMPPGLIGSMLTAIRQFAHDSFGREGDITELDEIQYGDERIIIESGPHAYVAAVVVGVQPTQFRTSLRDYISNLHLDHGNDLRNYDGDVDSVAHLQDDLTVFSSQVGTRDLTTPEPIMGNSSIPLAIGLLTLGLLACASTLFCLYFTYRLWPVAFASAPTSTAIIIPTNTITSVPANTPTLVVTATPLPPTAASTAVLLPTNTSLPEPSATTIAPTSTSVPTSTSQPTATVLAPTAPAPTATSGSEESTAVPAAETPIPSLTLGNVWVLEEPEVYEKRTGLLRKDTPVVVLAAYGDWVQIEWQVEEIDIARQGWVLQRWIEIFEPIPENLITPAPTP